MNESTAMDEGASDADEQFTGKYERPGRIGGWLVDRFYSAAIDLVRDGLAEAASVLEVGAGAGFSTERIVPRLPAGVRYMGSDVMASLVRKASLRNPAIPFVQQSVYSLALPDKSVDVILMFEVLEHLEQPDAALSELRRVARKRVVISTPREPLWCLLNFMRGKYLSGFGNTPGHIQHWSSRGLRNLASKQFRVVGRRQPVPWTILALDPRD